MSFHKHHFLPFLNPNLFRSAGPCRTGDLLASVQCQRTVWFTGVFLQELPRGSGAGSGQQRWHRLAPIPCLWRLLLYLPRWQQPEYG